MTCREITVNNIDIEMNWMSLLRVHVAIAGSHDTLRNAIETSSPKRT